MAAPSITADSEAWQRVAETVRRRRSDLGERTVDEVVERSKRHSDRGVSRSVVSLIENVRQTSYARRTLRALSVGLDWTPDSIEAILRGEEPIQATDDTNTARASATDDVVGIAALAEDLSPEDRARVEGYIRALLDGK